MLAALPVRTQGHVLEVTNWVEALRGRLRSGSAGSSSARIAEVAWLSRAALEAVAPRVADQVWKESNV